jgi:hypothetical protein
VESAAWPAESVTLDRLDQESGRDADDRPRRTGIARSDPASALCEHPSMTGGPTGLAGRDAEMARLLALGRDAALLIAGEAGSGKTSLVGLAAETLATEMTVIWTACLGTPRSASRCRRGS